MTEKVREEGLAGYEVGAWMGLGMWGVWQSQAKCLF